MQNYSTSRSSSPPSYVTSKQLPRVERQESPVNFSSVHQLKAPPRLDNRPEYTTKPIQQLPRVKRQESPVNFSSVHQLKAPPRPDNHPETTTKPIQKQEDSVSNQTGLPDNLKAGVENLSGYSLDNVKVHYNSPKPAQLQALAYTQGTDIHVAPGQEKHLPHETWHVVQQMQGRVKPTMQMKDNVNINDDVSLEKEADVMGAQGMRMSQNVNGQSVKTSSTSPQNPNKTVQRYVIVDNKPVVKLSDTEAFIDNKKVSVTGNKNKWIDDKYTRQYKTLQEFQNHVGGNPVEVGLAKKPGVWYRLPILSKDEFFVLGEGHGTFGYRELMEESNQKGKVLGESSSNPFMSAKPSSVLKKNETDQALDDEYVMESITAKAYYSLTKLKAFYEKQQKPGTDNSPPQLNRLPEDEWLENYQAVAGVRKQELYKPPYYK
ncbi:MAG: DUF4157 domain-containing protein, partial [Okeania sp. SIO2D1]|nr:DUF4157 domain-containing protein [Okeania sp. SIO2D1]